MAEELKKEIKTVTDASLDAEAKKWGAVYSKEKKVRIKIPVINKKDKAPVPVCINGYVYVIERGVSVEVPQTVADVLEKAEYI